jgi:threonine/homoserine/homoserine lactone efflux protein
MDLLIAFASLLGAWFLVLTIPGLNFIAVTQKSISVSRQSGLLVTLGVSAGAATWATASLLGLSAVFEYATWLYDSIRFVGGLYLIFIGLKVFFASFSSPNNLSDAHLASGSNNSSFRLGLFTSYSNPKTAAFFGSLFVMSFPPQAPGWFYVLTILMVFCASVAWYSLVACFFSISRVQAAYDRFRKVLDKFTGSLFVLLGVRLALSKS